MDICICRVWRNFKMSRIFDQIHQVDQVINFTDKFHVISTQLAPPLNFEMWMIQKQINLEETPGTVRWINDESGAPSDAPCTVRWMMDLVLKTVHVIKLHLALSPDTARTNFSSNNLFTINKFHIFTLSNIDSQALLFVKTSRATLKTTLNTYNGCFSDENSWHPRSPPSWFLY